MNTDASQSSPYSGPPPEEEAVITAPVARYYAMLVGVGLTGLGVLGLLPFFTAGDTLFGIMHVTPLDSVVHLLTGLAGLGVWLLHRSRYARAYAVGIGIIYVIVFTVGSIQLGNISGAASPGEQAPYVVADVVHVLLMLTGWLVAALASMQVGDRRTREVRNGRRWTFFSRTRLPSA